MGGGGFISVGMGGTEGDAIYGGEWAEVIGVAAHSSGSLRLACVGVLEHALRLLALSLNSC